MNRAVVVLLLLIANAFVAARHDSPPDPAPPARVDYSLGLFSTIDGGAAEPCSRRPVGDAALTITSPIASCASHSEAATAGLFDVRL